MDSCYHIGRLKVLNTIERVTINGIIVKSRLTREPMYIHNEGTMKC